METLILAAVGLGICAAIYRYVSDHKPHLVELYDAKSRSSYWKLYGKRGEFVKYLYNEEDAYDELRAHLKAHRTHKKITAKDLVE